MCGRINSTRYILSWHKPSLLFSRGCILRIWLELLPGSVRPFRLGFVSAKTRAVDWAISHCLSLSFGAVLRGITTEGLKTAYHESPVFSLEKYRQCCQCVDLL